ncbi:YiiX/YebB-like N1pC/P60 family cysteine hydrolase [Aliarcobacter lanthieri]|uniref:YiiX/YebB-like N1pC/P60 family cysteine hydrolase n=1 Tax=Aliarcobacter lanthieri TaxID=1355374 RepID=UPI00047E9458|nr:YiiX/YebB-like N1pC/P60 family cysteine hydrolase [Aliarcobacter lanthieri]QKF59574.1 permuted papain-like amidase enzyme, YaeF/YiiX, C92 family [Aliarcobacter lanthieri]
MKIRLIVIIFILLFASVEVKKFMDKKEKDLTIESLRETLELKNGDIIVRREDNPLSDFFATLDGAGFSHIGILANSKDGFVVFHLEVDENSDEMKVSSIKDFVNFSKKIAVYRHKEAIDEDKLSQILINFLKDNPKFDFEFSLENDTFYCTEFVNNIYFKLFNENLYTYMYEFDGKSGISINSLIQNPNLDKRYELEF